MITSTQKTREIHICSRHLNHTFRFVSAFQLHGAVALYAVYKIKLCIHRNKQHQMNSFLQLLKRLSVIVDLESNLGLHKQNKGT